VKIARVSIAVFAALVAVLSLVDILPPAEAAPEQPTAAGDHLLLSEVFYDAAGSDNNLEWIEVYNPTGSAINLGNYSLGNGGNDYTYSRVQLNGTILAGECRVIGGPASNLTNHLPLLNQAIDFSPDFQNGGTPADGIALFGVKAVSIAVQTIPVDAVIYGTANASNLIDESGAAHPPDAAGAPPGQSLQRRDITGTWSIQVAPTPNDCSAIFNPPAPAPPHDDVLISAVHYDAYANGDEGFRLTNVGTQSITLTNWIATDGEGALNLSGTLNAGQSIWIAKRAVTFTQQFGFRPDYEYDADTDPLVPNLAGTSPLLNDNGDELVIREGADHWIDAVVWGSVTNTTWISGWAGSAVQRYANGNIAATGQILHRRLDESTGAMAADSDSASDWANHNADPVLGRRPLYPGWDLEQFWRPAVVTATARLTVAIAPDNAYRVISDLLGSAQQSIQLEAHSFENLALADVLTRAIQARGISVTILLEGGPVGGVEDQELWICQRIESAGGDCWFMITDSANGIYDRYTYLHAKMIIVDERIVAIGSENLSPNGLPYDDFADGTFGQRGAYLVTDAPGVVSRTLQIWSADFDPAHRDIFAWGSGAYGPPPTGFTPIYTSGGSGYAIRHPAPLSLTAPLTFELITSPESSLRTSDALLGWIAQAGSGDGIDAEQLDEPPYWGDSSSTPAADPNLRLKALIDAASRGARVRLLLDGYFDDATSPTSNEATRVYVESLRALSPTLASHLEVRRGNPARGGIHNKMFLLRVGDRKIIHVGSLNGTETSNKVNREIALQVESAAAYDYLKAMFESDWATQPRVYLPIVLRNYMPPANHLLIGKVMYLGGDEWVQVYNPTAITVSLGSYKIGDEEAPGGGGFGFDGMWRFPLAATIAPGQKINIATTFTAFYADFGRDPDFAFFDGVPGVTQMSPYLAWTSAVTFTLSNTGDEVLLLGSTDQVVDGVAWGTGSLPGNVSCAALVPPPYASIDRTPIGQDTDSCPADFVANPSPLP